MAVTVYVGEVRGAPVRSSDQFPVVGDVNCASLPNVYVLLLTLTVRFGAFAESNVPVIFGVVVAAAKAFTVGALKVAVTIWTLTFLNVGGTSFTTELAVL